MRRASGFTLLELMIVVTILGILASIGVPAYLGGLRTARITKATQELRVISQAVDTFRAQAGRMPLTLHEVGHGGRRDPWGIPYCYLNYGSGTGDGLDWAIRAGLVDPSAIIASASSLTSMANASTGVAGASGSGATVASGGTGTTGGMGGTAMVGSGSGGASGTGGTGAAGGAGRGAAGAAGTATTTSATSTTSAPATSSTGGAGVGTQLAGVASTLTGEAVADLARALRDVDLALAPIFAAVPIATTRRRDKYLFPLNTDYDLFSLGPDGQSAASLGNAMALDDVIRANDGGFFGVASTY